MPAPESDQPVGSRRGRSPSGQWMLVSVEWPPGNDCEHDGGRDRGAEIPRGSCVDSACASLQWDRAASEGSTVGCWPRWAAATSASWPAVRTSPQCETGSMQRMLFGEYTGGRSRQTGSIPPPATESTFVLRVRWHQMKTGHQAHSRAPGSRNGHVLVVSLRLSS
jgi:hypothetical protein